ncbi:MAG: hypothetical protein CL674_11275 [Bdellovibrionaceae bacterium]|nr:hypothetical protein [Pseudobdellovibrionaceae bacterium]|tara:strand:- start:16000 stop:16893 length:894 start_codon:yes stop_codon:yes gene_type:complete
MFKSFLLFAFTVSLLTSSFIGNAAETHSMVFCRASASKRLEPEYLFPPAEGIQGEVTAKHHDDFINLIAYLQESPTNDFQKLQALGVVRNGGLIAKVETSQSEFVLKQITDKTTVRNDILSFEIMKLFLKDNPDIQVRIAEHEYLPGFGFKLEYIPGVTMNHIGYEVERPAQEVYKSLKFSPIFERIEETEVPLKIATEAYENYRQFQLRLETWVNEQFPNGQEFVDDNGYMRYQMYKLKLDDIRKRPETKKLLRLAYQSFFHRINPFIRPTVRIFPHSKNILIDARDGSLVLIDPY